LEGHRNYSIVIAEDEHRIRENIAKKIPAANPRFEVARTAANGEDALEIIENRCPDLLITDIKMPVMDGLELIEELYLSMPELPVIILSGYDDFNYAKRAIHFGVREYILKPVSMRELKDALERLEILLDKSLAYLPESTGCYDPSTAANDLCGNIIEFMRARYKDDISISDMAETFRLNPTYMSRIFKRQTGTTPTRFLTELRINHAKKMISDNPDLEIKEIASALGFVDQGYFSRLFKKETGMSPGSYRGR